MASANFFSSPSALPAFQFAWASTEHKTQFLAIGMVRQIIALSIINNLSSRPLLPYAPSRNGWRTDETRKRATLERVDRVNPINDFLCFLALPFFTLPLAHNTQKADLAVASMTINYARWDKSLSTSLDTLLSALINLDVVIPRQGKCYWLLEALHEPGNIHSVQGMALFTENTLSHVSAVDI